MAVEGFQRRPKKSADLPESAGCYSPSYDQAAMSSGALRSPYIGGALP
jgi:hypothetical protein